MQSQINRHQLSQIVLYISKSYETYIVQKDGDIFVLDKMKTPNVPIPAQKSKISFKTILWPNGQVVGQQKDKKIAFIGLTNCDTRALNILLDEFSETDLLPTRENIFILSSECAPDESCFCTALDSKISGYDLHLQTAKNGYAIFSGTKTGEQTLKESGVKNTLIKPKIKEIKLDNKNLIEKNKLKEAIADFGLYQEFWQKIANNCFGCGSCSAVCPLCFCFRRTETNKSDGTAKICLNWDACFATSFSQTQNQHDTKPKRVNRLYNWYHHKFVRADFRKQHFLCTGCGRCIAVCPAHLNQYKIISSIADHEEKIRHE